MNRTFVPSLAFVLSLGLVACSSPPAATPGDGGTTTDVSSGVDGGTPGSTFCARLRTLACPNASNCSSSLDPAMAASSPCRSLYTTFLTCLDGAAASVTCAQVASSPPSACSAQFMAVEACSRMMPEGGTTADASDGMSTAAPLPAPSDGEWNATASYSLTGGNLMSAQAGTGMAFLAPAPTGGPANGYSLSFMWDSFLGAPGGDADCHFGLIYNSTARTYSFSADPLLTTGCVITPMGEDPTTLTFSDARVSRAAAGNLVVSVSVRGTGPRFMGTGALAIVWPAP